MPKDIKRLLQEKQTGQTVGRLMLEDLVASYRNATAPDGPQATLFTEEEKALLVGSLTQLEDIETYSDYRYIHEYLLGAQMYILLQSRSADTVFCRLTSHLELLRMAEQERQELALSDSYLQRGYAAEVFIPEHGPVFAENLSEYRSYLATWFAVETAMGLVGGMIGVQGTDSLAPALDVSLLRTLNALMEALPQEVIRPDKAQESALRQALSGLLKPVDPDQLRPTEAAIQAAKAQLSIPVVYGGMQQIYALLKREAP